MELGARRRDAMLMILTEIQKAQRFEVGLFLCGDLSSSGRMDNRVQVCKSHSGYPRTATPWVHMTMSS